MAFEKINKLLLKVFGSRNERLLKVYYAVAEKAGEYEANVKQLSDEQLKSKTGEFKEKLQTGSQPEQILPEVFAVVREVARRQVEMRHFNVQLIGGNVLYEGKIAEMATGEGKTLVATLAAYLVHLMGNRVHIVTVNDYLASRDAEWMKPVYEGLGLTVGALQSDMETSGDVRKSQYECDITYGTNNEFGFDYLRDNMKSSLEQMVQGDLEYAIIDEVDSILIDEARTPLIISGPAFDDVTRYKRADEVARQLIVKQKDYDRVKSDVDSAERKLANAEGELSDAKKRKDKSRIEKAQNEIEHQQSAYQQAQAKLEQKVQYYEVEYDKKSVHLTHEGIGAAQEIAGVGSFFVGSNMEWPHLLEQSLRAHMAFEREKDYVVMDGKVVIVDEFTGRLMEGRQWSEGLHQAIEAKENVSIKEESQTLATITLQNFFKLYGKLAGMTGTAATEAEEFMNIYALDVVIIPTNRPCIREDKNDIIYKTMKEKFDAIVDNINEISGAGRPVLVGSVSVEKSEKLSGLLKRKYGIEHEVLNAKHHQREAAIVTKAGQQHKGRDGKIRGNVTIATNMAGRGTDIKLGDGVAEIGGLHVLGSERHEARRIDNQLRGRTARQGQKGSSQFFLSFDDDLMQIFAPEWTIKALSWIGWEEGQPIYHKRISKGIEKAQKKVEERNFEMRKSVLEYDEVMDYQRKIFYSRRREILAGENLKEIIQRMIHDAIKDNCREMLEEESPLRTIAEWADKNFNIQVKISELKNLKPLEVEYLIKDRIKDNIQADISRTLGEYLVDEQDSDTWDINGLNRWAMSSFKVNIPTSKIKHFSADEIEQQLKEGAFEQLDNRDLPEVYEFLKEGFAVKRLCEWASSKFDIKVDIDEIKDCTVEQAENLLCKKVDEKYRRREVEYPVEYAMNMVFARQGENVYGFDSVVKWANKKYNAGFTVEEIQQLSPRKLHKKLLELSEQYNNGKLEQEINERIDSCDSRELADWAKERFDVNISEDKLQSSEIAKPKLLKAGREFMRSELSGLEKYVLLQIYDSSWKEHLYVMDHLKSSIWMQSLAQKDPKIEYKREGFREFENMLDSIEDKVTDTIFKVRLEAGTQRRNVYQVSSTEHNRVDQFAAAEKQRAAAQAPQAERKVKQIKRKTPKVGRNDPCPCGSGKKYKKCCGKAN
jgi:preprotein translocase subunit SecA